MEEFVFVEPMEINREKAEYLSLRYRYLVIAPRYKWGSLRSSIETEHPLGGIWAYEHEKRVSPDIPILMSCFIKA